MEVKRKKGTFLRGEKIRIHDNQKKKRLKDQKGPGSPIDEREKRRAKKGGRIQEKRTSTAKKEREKATHLKRKAKLGLARKKCSLLGEVPKDSHKGRFEDRGGGTTRSSQRVLSRASHAGHRKKKRALAQNTGKS